MPVPPRLTPPICIRCHSRNVKLRRVITSSGVSQVAWRCIDGDHWAENPKRSLPHADVIQVLNRYGVTIEDLSVIEDYRSEKYRCVICGDPAEDHHWAPQALADAFGDDWHKWPHAPLCVKHHRQWHDIVTPELAHMKRPAG